MLWLRILIIFFMNGDAEKAAHVRLTMLLEHVYLLCELLVQYSEIEKLNIGQLQQRNCLLELA